jgi:hypothetical protein
LRGRDLNPRPSGYEPDELPGCSTPHCENNFDIHVAQIEKTAHELWSGRKSILIAQAAMHREREIKSWESAHVIRIRLPGLES